MEGQDRAATPPLDHESASLMTEEPAAASIGQDAGWTVENVSVRKAENGGYIVNCSKRREAKSAGNSVGPPSDYQSKDYAFSTWNEASQFIGGEFGEGQAAAAPAASVAPPIAASTAAPAADEYDEDEA